MSNHRCEAVNICLENHPNAQNLSICKVFGYTVCVRTEDFKDCKVGIYIPPDSVCPKDDRFGFLGEHNRIKVRKLRGIISQGLLMPATFCAEADIGKDYMSEWGITHYEPPLPFSSGGEDEREPDGWYPTYDVENFNRYGHLFVPGEEVVVSEKLHGASGRYVWTEDRMFAGSRTSWKKQDSKNLWWQALDRNPWIEKWCKSHPGLALYGEVFGRVQSLKYGAGPSDMFFKAFDILDKNQWLDYVKTIRQNGEIDWVPEIWKGPFDENQIRYLAEGETAVPGANHMREGIVIRPIVERQHPEIGRVQLKLVSNAYLEKY